MKEIYSKQETLKQEAEEYFPLLNLTNNKSWEVVEENLQLLGHRKSFIAGANSKYVEIQKIVFALDYLYKYREATFGKGKNLIEELVEQLRKLENEKNI
jgi:hypothetical protein